ncbi:hypothetical protein M9H77_12287 [Catharanthus roseus]|uniref:Uncharacterized protein n=1 Tax=Catharanthus roseus TaxID=4058 RepID=A0ACC0BH61_CATRO|nr:hypothetical protein M9H77_12287 [Catharanthus roseus]
MDFVRKKKCKKKSRDSSPKVVYISSPMKVKTSASKFRTIVQKLTGQDSDISTYMDARNNNNNTKDFEILPDSFGAQVVSSKSSSSSSASSLMDRPRESPLTSSDSFSFSDVFINSAGTGIDQEQQYLQGFLPSNFFGNSSQLDIDVLGSYI